MSHQKINKIQSPIKGKYLSMIEPKFQSPQQNIFNSRITQKRKPIFNQTPRRSSVSNQSSLRKQIFPKTQKSKQKSQLQNKNQYFSHLKQSNQVAGRIGDQSQEYDEKDLYEQNLNQSYSVKSSIIEDDNGLQQVKRQLFPQTPIKKILQKQQKNSSNKLYQGRQFSNSNWKRHLYENDDQYERNIKKQIFDDESISTNNVQKTVAKIMSFNTPAKRQKQVIQSLDPQKREQSNEVKKYSEKFYQSQKVQKLIEENVQNQTYNTASKTKNTKYLQKDIALQLRQLHTRMLQKSKACSQIDIQNISLHEQNQRLRKQLQVLKKNQDLSTQLNLKPQSASKTRSLQNQNLKYRIKMQKAKTMLQKMLQMGQIQQQNSQIINNNSIINVRSTLAQVIKQLEY